MAAVRSAPTLTSVWRTGAPDVYASSAVPATVVASHDDGANWTSVPLGDNQTVISGVAAGASGAVFAVGYEQGQAFVSFFARSGDGGATFTALAAPSGYLNTVWVDPVLGLLVGGSDAAGAIVARSTDGGSTWTVTHPAGIATLNGFWVSNAGAIYAAGIEGAAESSGGLGIVIRSLDGGATWTPLLSGSSATSASSTPPQPFYAIAGTGDGQRLVAVGDSLTIAESFDGGVTWIVDQGAPATTTQPSTFAGDILTSVWVPDSTSDPYIGGWNFDSGGVLRSLDFNAPADVFTTWDIVSGNSAIYAVAGTAANDVWAVGLGGLIARKTHR